MILAVFSRIAANALCCLLALVASASAECAWVMWEFKEEYWVKANSLESGWTILRTYDARAECRADQAKLLSGETGWFPPFAGRSRLDDGFYVAVQVDGQTVRTIKQRALCVPDTIDPRGPKGTK